MIPKATPCIIILLALVACGSNPPPTPAAGEQPVSATSIWFDYQENEPRANETWKGKWIYLRLAGVDVVETGGMVYMHMDSLGLNKIVLDYKNDQDVLDFNRGDELLAYCKLAGYHLNLWLSFNDCRPVQ